MKTEAIGYPGLIRKAFVVTAISLLTGLTGWAQTYPIYVGTTQPVKDEFNINLKGDFNTPLESRDRVELRWATNGVIYPPDYSGYPDPRNPLFSNGVTAVGVGVSPGLVNPGVFGMALYKPRPANRARLFLRVFNAPNLAAASFYADSALFIITNSMSSYDVTFGAMQPIDPRDTDNDGLNNSWEKSYGTDQALTDTDGDGMGDWQETRAGTDALNPDSSFIMAWVTVGDGDDAVVAWDSVSGKRYQVEYSSDDLKDDPIYQNVSGVITATGAITETTITNGFLSDIGHYRVRLVED